MFTKSLCTVIVAGLFATVALADWTPVKPEGARCKIAFPSETKLQTVPPDPEAGRSELFVLATDEAVAPVSYALMWNDFVGDRATALKSISEAQKQDALAKGRDGWVQIANGKLESQRKLKIGEHPGLEFFVSSANGKLMRVQLFLANERLYQIAAQGPRDVIQGGEADEFFKSFRLLRGN
jgi:hypothetical protein